MERFQVQAENCLFIGDSLVSDFYPSTEIGMQSICLRKTTFSSSNRVIDFNHLAFLNLENKEQYWESALNDLFHLPGFILPKSKASLIICQGGFIWESSNSSVKFKSII